MTTTSKTTARERATADLDRFASYTALARVVLARLTDSMTTELGDELTEDDLQAFVTLDRMKEDLDRIARELAPTGEHSSRQAGGTLADWLAGGHYYRWAY